MIIRENRYNFIKQCRNKRVIPFWERDASNLERDKEWKSTKSRVFSSLSFHPPSPSPIGGAIKRSLSEPFSLTKIQGKEDHLAFLEVLLVLLKNKKGSWSFLDD